MIAAPAPEPLAELVTGSSPTDIRYLHRFLEEVCHKTGLNPDQYSNLLVSVSEAFNNAVLHGNRCRKEKVVRLHAELRQPNLLVVRVEDEGDGFDPTTLPDPTRPEALLRENGRGIFLMRNLSAGVQYLEKGNIVEISFRA